MFNVVGLNEFAALANSELTCWLCQKPVSGRAMFCHHCGTIQPVRDIDHFARLGLSRRIDIDTEMLDTQFEALSRTLDPQRFMIRGLGERGYAMKQLDMLNIAYETLREPLRRGRYWLSLHEKELNKDEVSNSFVRQLRHDLETAAEPSQCDRVAHRAGLAMEQGIMGLMQALRGENWQQANDTLVEIDGLESILGEVRSRRADLSGSFK